MPEPEQPALSEREAAEFLGITVGRLRRLRKQGAIPAISQGWNRYRYHLKDLMAYAESAAAATEISPKTNNSAAPIEDAPPADAIRDLKSAFTDMCPPEPEKSTEPSASDEDDSAPIVRMVNAILVSTIESGASELRIEPDRRSVRIRIKIDGIWHEMMAFPKHIQTPILNRFQVMANQNPYRFHPQVGTVWIKHGDKDYNLRVTAVMTAYGRTLSISIYQSQWNKGCSSLGLYPSNQVILEDRCLLPGLLIFVSPIGGGATTTAYSFLNLANGTDRNIIAFEDAQTYFMFGIQQVYANPRTSHMLPEILPFLLRQSPDLLFVGDIDAPEAAESALNAAEQGISVWATMHARNAVSALLRLKAMGIAPERIGYTVHTVCAQHLVRCICPDCKTEETITDPKILDFLYRLHDEKPEAQTLYDGAGCDACRQKGFKGLLGSFEVLRMTEEFAAHFSQNQPVSALYDTARRDGFLPIGEDAGRKAVDGVVAWREVVRVRVVSGYGYSGVVA
ncbi:MAG: hypothetical protein OHK0029_01690 [Armatimonadaceae bacterium]